MNIYKKLETFGIEISEETNENLVYKKDIIKLLKYNDEITVICNKIFS